MKTAAIAAITITVAEAKRFACGGAGGLTGVLTGILAGTSVVAICHQTGKPDLSHYGLPLVTVEARSAACCDASHLEV